MALGFEANTTLLLDDLAGEVIAGVSFDTTLSASLVFAVPHPTLRVNA